MEKDILEEDKRVALLASNIEFEKPLESHKLVIWDASDKISPIMEVQEYYKKKALDAVGIPRKYFGGIDPYKEDAPLSLWVQIEEKIRRVYKKINLR